MISLRCKPKCYINILPTSEFDWDCIKIDAEKKIIYIRQLFEFHSSFEIKVLPKFWCFKTDGIFMNSCQNEIYSTVTDQVIGNVFLGINNVLISYGQNFSGKTFCLSGFYNQFDLRGIVPRFVSDLFLQKVALEEDISTQIWVSSVDVYGNAIYDLLSKPTKPCKEAKEVKKVKIKSEIHCLELLFQAESKRMIMDQKTYNAHTACNIITFTVEMVSLHSNEPNDKISMVHFVDLAGVETVQRNPLTSFKNYSNQGQANLTKTLMEIFALRSQGTFKKSYNLHVNQRIHKITQYLDKSFSPSSRIILMCHIRPYHEDLMITLSLLKFSMAIRGMPMTKPECHLRSNYEMTIKNLQENIQSLNDELLLRNLWGERCPMKISQDRVEFVKRSVESFLKGNLTELELLSLVDDCSLVLSCIKSLRKEEKQKEMESMAVQTDDSDFLSWLSEKESGEKRRKSTVKGSFIKEKTSIEDSSKHISFEDKPKKLSKTDKSKKGKSGKTKSDTSSKKKGKRASKVPEKPILVSQEVQVNLIEPNAKLPKIDSRQSLWAEFMISRPEIQVFLNKLNVVVEDKDKKLLDESSTFDEISSCLRKKQMDLNKMASLRHIDRSEIYDKDGKVVVSEEESNLVKELKNLQKDFEISQQKLTEAQTNWLDALEKMNCEKQIIEEEFKMFCISNNLLILNQEMSSPEDFDENLTSNENFTLPAQKEYDTTTSGVLNLIPEITEFDEKLQETYLFLQKNYLRNASNKL